MVMNRRNENRKRRKSGRARTNALNSMTPQGEALWCMRNVENAHGFQESEAEQTFIRVPAVGESEVIE